MRLTDSLFIAVVATALQTGTASGLPPTLRQDIEAAATAPGNPAGQPISIERARTPGADSAVNEPPVPPPPPAPPPPPPGPDVFGMSATPQKIGLEDDRWIRIGALPSRNPILAAMIASASTMTRYQQASFVQATINGRLTYRLDQDNWGAKDYWASADETIARGAGDCEDLALVKLQALRLLGFHERDLFLMTGTRPSGEEHALLLVRIDGRFWVLEDGLNRIVRAESFRMFKPAVTYGAGWKWVHGPLQATVPNSPAVAAASAKPLP